MAKLFKLVGIGGYIGFMTICAVFNCPSMEIANMLIAFLGAAMVSYVLIMGTIPVKGI